MGPEQDRFPLHYKVGTNEPLAVGQLRQGARYLAPGGILDKVRIPALILRGVISNLLVFLFLILLFVFVTEFVYEVGSRVRLRLGYLVLVGVVAFVSLVIASPLITRFLHIRSSWARRNLQEMAFSVILVALLFIVFLVPMLILVDQSFDASWSEVKKSIMANLLRPFEPRDYLQWLMVLALLVAFMFAGRASQHVARLGGKIMLFVLGLLGPAFLFLIYIALLAMVVDSPYITAKELFVLDATYANKLDEMDRVSPDLRREFKDNHIRLATTAQVITLEADLRWLIHDGGRGYALMLEQGGVSVYPDYQYALNRGSIPPEFRAALARKDYRLGTQARSLPEFRDNRFEIIGYHVYWVVHEPNSGEWSLEQIVAGSTLAEILQRISYTIQISDASTGVLIHEGVSLSDDDLGQAIRFVEQVNPHDVVLLVDNSTPPFADQKGFRRTFREALEKALVSLRPTVRMAVFWFDQHVYEAGTLESLTTETKQALLQRLFGDEAEPLPRVDFQGQRSNSPAALERAMRELRENGRDWVRKSIVLVSDGFIEVTANRHDTDLQDWIEQDFARDAQTAGIRLYGIALSAQAKFDLFATMVRQTGGAYYPVFESRTGVSFKDLFDAMENIKASAGSHLVSPLDQVTISDRERGTRFALTRAKDGVRIRKTLRERELTPAGLADPTGRLRDVFRDNSIELGDGTTISQIGDGRWEVLDPYRYTISRSGTTVEDQTQRRRLGRRLRRAA